MTREISADNAAMHEFGNGTYKTCRNDCGCLLAAGNQALKLRDDLMMLSKRKDHRRPRCVVLPRELGTSQTLGVALAERGARLARRLAMKFLPLPFSLPARFQTIRREPPGRCSGGTPN